MIAMSFACAAVAMLSGWLTDDGALIIGGFLCALIGFACLLHDGYERNLNASAVLLESEARQADWERHRAA